MVAAVVVDECVESLCRNGCEAVRGAIAAMERGAELPETAGLDPADRARVLAELKNIMAVYDQGRYEVRGTRFEGQR